MIHCDLWRPYNNPSLCKLFYFLTIVDDFSRGVWVYLIRDKSQVKQALRNFIALVLRQFEKNVKIIQSDNEMEFTCLTSEFKEKGIITKYHALECHKKLEELRGKIYTF